MTKLLAVIAAVSLTFGAAGLTSAYMSGGATTVITATNGTVLVPTVTLKDTQQKAATTTVKNVKKVVLPEERTVFLLGEVGYNATSIAREITDLANQSDEPIYLVIDSPGGQVFRGALIISAIESSRAPVYTICYNICASMAAMIHQYGKQRLAIDRAVLMFHPAAAMYGGDVDRIVSFSQFAQRYVNKMDAYVANRAGMDLQLYNSMVSVEMWKDAEDAMAMNLVDGLVYLDVDSGDMIDSILEERGFINKDYIDFVGPRMGK